MGDPPRTPEPLCPFCGQAMDEAIADLGCWDGVLRLECASCGRSADVRQVVTVEYETQARDDDETA